MTVKTATEVRAEFQKRGLSIAEWAVSNGLNSTLVYEVLRGQRKCIRGQSHKVAVLLGIKAGQVADAKTFRPGAGNDKD